MWKSGALISLPSFYSIILISLWNYSLLHFKFNFFLQQWAEEIEQFIKWKFSMLYMKYWYSKFMNSMKCYLDFLGWYLQQKKYNSFNKWNGDCFVQMLWKHTKIIKQINDEFLYFLQCWPCWPMTQALRSVPRTPRSSVSSPPSPPTSKSWTQNYTVSNKQWYSLSQIFLRSQGFFSCVCVGGGRGCFYFWGLINFMYVRS